MDIDKCKKEAKIAIDGEEIERFNIIPLPGLPTCTDFRGT